jgi:hypothetical protein
MIKIMCKNLGSWYGIQECFPCKAIANEYTGELSIEIDKKYNKLVHLIFGDAIVRNI